MLTSKHTCKAPCRCTRCCIMCEVFMRHIVGPFLQTLEHSSLHLCDSKEGFASVLICYFVLRACPDSSKGDFSLCQRRYYTRINQRHRPAPHDGSSTGTPSSDRAPVLRGPAHSGVLRQRRVRPPQGGSIRRFRVGHACERLQPLSMQASPDQTCVHCHSSGNSLCTPNPT